MATSIKFLNEGFKRYFVENIEEDDFNEDESWTCLESKSVEDIDGFTTDYTMYTNGDMFVCIFGDKDIYTPENSEFDFETYDEDEAYEWFESYDTDFYESLNRNVKPRN